MDNPSTLPDMSNMDSSSMPSTSSAQGGNRYILPDPTGDVPSTNRPLVKAYRRSRSGCFTCRLRRKKCDEERPACSSCSKHGLRCDYKTPQWWATNEQRLQQRDRIKGRIRQTKVIEKDGSLQKYMDRIKAMSQKSPVATEFEMGQPLLAEQDNHPALAGPLPTPVSASITTPVTPFGFDFKAGSEGLWPMLPPSNTFSASSFNPINPLQAQLPTPEMAGDEWFRNTPTVTPTVAATGSSFYVPPMPEPPQPLQPMQPMQPTQPMQPMQSMQSLQPLQPLQPEPQLQTQSQPQPQPQPQLQTFSPMNTIGFGYASQPLSSLLQSMVPINETDRPLLNHFIDSVLPLVFPIADAMQTDPMRIQEVLNSVKTNRSYMHCCLSVAAIHLKTSMGMVDEMDHDIVKHRYEAICQLCKALNRTSSQMEVMDATLAMIFYHCTVGTSDDYLPDIPWNAHFRAVSNLVRKLPQAPSRLNVSLITWIDILGATMLGETPQFAHTYRTKHLQGVSSGLQSLMGCDDRIMYLISEIACLESLKLEGKIDNLIVCHHITALTAQIDWTEPLDQLLEAPFTPTGVVRPEMLTKIVTSLFRIATRIYLQSLLPVFNPYNTSIISLINAITDTLQYIPAGAHGFDRSIVWPLFMAGAHSVPSSPFRKLMAERVTALGYLGDYGSFGRMYRVLKEIWQVVDGSSSSPEPSTTVQSVGSEEASSSLPGPSSPELHWRDVMKRNKWNYLLM